MSQTLTPNDGRRMSTMSTQGQDYDAKSLHTITTGSNETIISANRRMFFLELNPFAPVSVVLIHILFSSHLEWQHIWPKLPEYHLLVPDLPCHSKSRNLCKKEDYSVGLCADLVAEMVREHAHDGRAHFVGVGTSGFIILDIIRRHPDVVASGFVSGVRPLKGMRLTVNRYPRLLYAGIWSILRSPGSLFFKLSGYGSEYLGDDLLEVIKQNGSSRLAEAGCAFVNEWQEDQFMEAGSRDIKLCMISGGKVEDPEGVRQAAKLLKAQSNGGGGSATCAYHIPEAALCWNLQFPQLFAKAVQCWVERRPMPVELEEMPI